MQKNFLWRPSKNQLQKLCYFHALQTVWVFLDKENEYKRQLYYFHVFAIRQLRVHFFLTTWSHKDYFCLFNFIKLLIGGYGVISL